MSLKKILFIGVLSFSCIQTHATSREMRTIGNTLKRDFVNNREKFCSNIFKLKIREWKDYGDQRVVKAFAAEIGVLNKMCYDQIPYYSHSETLQIVDTLERQILGY